jgi:hypothetical protein
MTSTHIAFVSDGQWPMPLATGAGIKSTPISRGSDPNG